MKATEIMINQIDILERMRAITTDAEKSAFTRDLSWFYLNQLDKSELKKLDVFENALDWGIGLKLMQLVRHGLKNRTRFTNMPLSRVLEVC